MTVADLVAAVIVIGMTLYAWSGIADFGAGFWDLAAGGKARAETPGHVFCQRRSVRPSPPPLRLSIISAATASCDRS